MPEGFSVGGVIDSYLEAIGGREVLEKVQNIKTLYVAEVQGMVIEAEEIKSDLGKSLGVSKMGGQVIQRKVVSDGVAYQEVMGQRREIEGSELETSVIQSYPFPELNFDAKDFEYLGIIEVGDATGHHIKINDNLSQVYDTENSLLIQLTSTDETEGQVVETDVQFKDYKEVEGISIPHTMTTRQAGIDIIAELKSIKFNVELEDSVFE